MTQGTKSLLPMTFIGRSRLDSSAIIATMLRQPDGLKATASKALATSR
jgi:hypothetical protein